MSILPMGVRTLEKDLHRRNFPVVGVLLCFHTQKEYQMSSQMDVARFMAKIAQLRFGEGVLVVIPTEVSGVVKILGGKLIPTLFENEYMFIVTGDVGRELIDDEVVSPEGL